MSGKKESKDNGEDRVDESLLNDFGPEGYRVLMEGIDAIIDVTRQFNGSYSDFQKTVEDSYQRGMVSEANGVIKGMEKKQDSDG